MSRKSDDDDMLAILRGPTPAERDSRMRVLWAEAEAAFRRDPEYAIELAKAASAAARGVRAPTPAAMADRQSGALR